MRIKTYYCATVIVKNTPTDWEIREANSSGTSYKVTLLNGEDVTQLKVVNDPDSKIRSSVYDKLEKNKTYTFTLDVSLGNDGKCSMKIIDAIEFDLEEAVKAEKQKVKSKQSFPRDKRVKELTFDQLRGGLCSFVTSC